jgi:hypothetical protein
MGNNTTRAEDFIDDIPNCKLAGLPTIPRTIYKNTDFRLDMQGVRSFLPFPFSPLLHLSNSWQYQMTSGDPKKHNIQVQVNKGTTVTTLKKAAPRTVASVLVLQDDPPSAETIKKDLKASVTI